MDPLAFGGRDGVPGLGVSAHNSRGWSRPERSGRRSGYMDDQTSGHVATGNGDLDMLELAWAEADALALPVDHSRDAILRMLDEHR